MNNKFYPLSIPNAYLVTPWVYLVNKEPPYRGMGQGRYTAKIMFSTKSKAYNEIKKRESFFHEAEMLSKNDSFFTTLAGANDYFDEEKRIWTKQNLNLTEWVIVKISRSQGEHDLVSPKGKDIPKTPNNASYFCRGAVINFNGAISVINKFPIITIYGIQYVGKGFSDQIEKPQASKVSSFSPIEGAEDPFDLTLGTPDPSVMDIEYIDTVDDHPPF